VGAIEADPEETVIVAPPFPSYAAMDKKIAGCAVNTGMILLHPYIAAKMPLL
jgi:hypothetical protein